MTRPAAVTRRARAAAAQRWRPEHVRCLLVGAAPPAEPSRYFYFDDVRTQDALFRHVAQVVLGDPGDRDAKPARLAELRERGVFAVELSPDPVPDSALPPRVPALVARCRRLRPDAVVLIGAPVYDLIYNRLADAGLPVVPVRVPYPGYGQRQRFLARFTEAMQLAGIL